ncbi:MAG: AAA family ATPase [Shewanella sp.]
MANNYIVAVCGLAGNGKSHSLMHIPNQNSWLYLNCETNKPLPFVHKFKEVVVTSPANLKKLIQQGAANPKCEGIIVDTLTSALDMQEMHAKRTSDDKYQIWDKYRDYILELFQSGVATCNKPIIFLCHVEMAKDIRGRSKLAISVKGSTANRGIESFFTNIVFADYVELSDLEEFKSPMLNITEDERIDDGKYVFQTRKTAMGLGLNIRSTDNLWSREETFIDNNIMHVLNKLKKLYGEE